MTKQKELFIVIQGKQMLEHPQKVVSIAKTVYYTFPTVT